MHFQTLCMNNIIIRIQGCEINEGIVWLKQFYSACRNETKKYNFEN